MIQKGSLINVVDNSGIKIVNCVHIYAKGYGKRYAKPGDMILVSVRKIGKRVRESVKLKLGDLVKAVVVRNRSVNSFSTTGNFNTFLSKNGVVLINNQDKFLGNRVFGYVPGLFRKTRYLKMTLMSAGTLPLS